MNRSLLALAVALGALALAAAPASASGVAYPDADWSEDFIPSSDGVMLHADVLRPKGAADATKTPVIVSIGPYFNRSGQTGPVGPVEGTQYAGRFGRVPARGERPVAAERPVRLTRRSVTRAGRAGARARPACRRTAPPGGRRCAP
jgi:hypothetical protein